MTVRATLCLLSSNYHPLSDTSTHSFTIKSNHFQFSVFANFQEHLLILPLYFSHPTLNPLPDNKIFDWFKLKQFADNNFEFDVSSRKFSKLVENTVGKEEIAHYEQFLLFPQCFQKVCFPRASKGVIVWEWVNCLSNFYLFINLCSSRRTCELWVNLTVKICPWSYFTFIKEIRKPCWWFNSNDWKKFLTWLINSSMTHPLKCESKMYPWKISKYIKQQRYY